MAVQSWIRENPGGPWTRRASLVEGLRAMACSPAAAVLLFTNDPEADTVELTAAMTLAAQTGLEPRQVVIGTDHPSAAWIRRLAASRAGYLWVTARPESTIAAVEALHVGEAAARVCAGLHMRLRDDTPLSVCGFKADLMVCSIARIRERCLAGGDFCPHRRHERHV